MVPGEPFRPLLISTTAATSDLIATVTGQPVEWVVPRGSV